MELISRTMQDMQNHDSDLVSDVSTSDQSSTTNLNKYLLRKKKIIYFFSIINYLVFIGHITSFNDKKKIVNNIKHNIL